MAQTAVSCPLAELDLADELRVNESTPLAGWQPMNGVSLRASGASTGEPVEFGSVTPVPTLPA